MLRELTKTPIVFGVCVFIVSVVLLGWGFGRGGCDPTYAHRHAGACRAAPHPQDLEFIVSMGLGIAGWAWARRR